MADEYNEWPEEGELVVCSVKSVKENGAYLDLDSYSGKEGFVFIGEIATGWVRNIRTHVREGQRVVAKVIGVKKDRESITLSIKSVSEERRRMPFNHGKTNNELHNYESSRGEDRLGCGKLQLFPKE